MADLFVVTVGGPDSDHGFQQAFKYGLDRAMREALQATQEFKQGTWTHPKLGFELEWETQHFDSKEDARKTSRILWKAIHLVDASANPIDNVCVFTEEEWKAYSE